MKEGCGQLILQESHASDLHEIVLDVIKCDALPCAQGKNPSKMMTE